MANILSVNEEHVFEQIKSAHSVYSRFEDDVCPASDFRSSLEALPEHDMRMAMQQDIFLNMLIFAVTICKAFSAW